MTLNLNHRGLKEDKRIDSQSPLTRGYIRLEDCLDLFNTDFGEVLDPRKCVCGAVGGGEEELYLTLHCHHQKDFCINMGSGETVFNGFVNCKGHVTRQCP